MFMTIGTEPTHRALKCYECVLVSCEKYSKPFSGFRDTKWTPTLICSPYLHIFEWLPRSSALPWVRSFGISPLSPLLACYCSSCFFLGVTSPLQKHPHLSHASVWHPFFFTRESDPVWTDRVERGRESMEADLDLTSGSAVATTTNTTCPFPLVSFIHSLVYRCCQQWRLWEKPRAVCLLPGRKT